MSIVTVPAIHISAEKKEMLGGVIGAIYNNYDPYVINEVVHILEDRNIEDKFRQVENMIGLTRGSRPLKERRVARVIFTVLGMIELINWAD